MRGREGSILSFASVVQRTCELERTVAEVGLDQDWRPSRPMGVDLPQQPPCGLGPPGEYHREAEIAAVVSTLLDGEGPVDGVGAARSW